MNVLIVVRNFYPSTLGGPSNTLYWLASSLVKSGLDVRVITTDDHIVDNSISRNLWTNLEGISVYYASVARGDKYHLSIVKLVRNVILNADILILSSVFYLPSLFSAYYAKRHNVKIIWSPRGELFPSAINNNVIKKLYVKGLKLLFGNYAVFHATSYDEEIYIKEYFGKNIRSFILPNYMRLPEKKEHADTEKFFLFVGRIAPIKALDKIIKGVALSRSFLASDIKLYIVGGVEDKYEDYYKTLKKLIFDLKLENNVIFKGSVVGAEKYKIYADAYFSLLLSDSENFGNVVIEALSQGTPVISSLGTPWKKLMTTKSGFWIDNTPECIAKTFDETISMNASMYNSYRENAYKLAKTFDVNENISLWIERIKSI